MAKRQFKSRPMPKRTDHHRLWIVGGIGATATVVIIIVFVSVFHGTSGTGGSSSGAQVGSDLHSLVVDPSNSNIVSVGGHTSSAVSSDGGKTFRVIPGLDNADTMAWSVSSDGKDQVVSGHGGLKTSDDGGSSWIDRTSQLPDTDVHAVGLDPNQPSHMWAEVVGRGISKSSDGGASWAPLGGEDLSLMGPILVRDSGTTLLASDMMQGLVGSSDGGKTWHSVDAQLPAGWLAADPNDPQHLLDAGNGIFSSADGGTTWQVVATAPAGTAAVAITKGAHPSWLAASLAGDQAVVYRSDDSGVTWKQVTI